MGKRKKKPKVREVEDKSQIKTSKIPQDNGMRFSFKYLDLSTSKFSIEELKEEYFRQLLRRLKALGAYPIKEFKQCSQRSLRNHPIRWEHTSEPGGFACLNEQLRDYTPYQFAISANECGRVHGLIIDSVFYIVWLDKEHGLYP